MIEVFNSLNEYLISGDFSNANTMDIFNQWINQSKIHLKKNEDFSLIIKYIDRMKKVDKKLLEHVLLTERGIMHGETK